ncbi:SAVED domain-containing protein [Halomonas ventosae]|uniref:SMODS-associated and fused to various effectors domain-containing protein n=1 Tax=Halomonas ventosae TaxID=229007 RepID=A0A4R6HVM8_9GAMM|nr:SAVED domain-containing protein [Halomonas ventosae]TDO12671.1 hypothetical protein DFO68_104184 [Halomonas ventosae]
MIKKLFENFVRKGTDWLFRVHSIEAIILKSAFGVLLAVFGVPPFVAFILRLILGTVPEEILSVQKTFTDIHILILAICSIAILIALSLIVYRVVSEAKNNSKKRVVVVEGRGLRDDDGSPLDQVVRKNTKGQIIPVLLDLRNRLDGKVIEPERALSEIYSVHRTILQHKKSSERSSLKVFYGGLTSVPYTFLTGVLLDDEGVIDLYDWDRTRENWRKLDEEDDGAEFSVNGVERVVHEEDVVIALAFSYAIDDKNLKSTFNYPAVRLTLDGMSSDAHWSREKQNRLAQQFFEVVKQLSEHDVKRIHLVMAAPNSVVFTFGRRYDKRNLPELIVYQFERGKERAYPWGVLMPVAGVDYAKIFFSGD